MRYGGLFDLSIASTYILIGKLSMTMLFVNQGLHKLMLDVNFYARAPMLWFQKGLEGISTKALFEVAH